jgi:hypothetical protein
MRAKCGVNRVTENRGDLILGHEPVHDPEYGHKKTPGD